jgi:hypothetical protein
MAGRRAGKYAVVQQLCDELDWINAQLIEARPAQYERPPRSGDPIWRAWYHSVPIVDEAVQALAELAELLHAKVPFSRREPAARAADPAVTSDATKGEPD